jgi:hypothetical protein
MNSIPLDRPVLTQTAAEYAGCGIMLLPPHGVVEWLELLLRLPELSCSTLHLETGYNGRELSL